ncbi:hypothetical protein PPHE_a1950 [Pseudoalteromonas phenolica O-BC30]|nr:hypothetical protein [Pseudoalteromonas phenolica O-BC30]
MAENAPTELIHHGCDINQFSLLNFSLPLFILTSYFRKSSNLFIGIFNIKHPEFVLPITNTKVSKHYQTALHYLINVAEQSL